MIEQHVRPAWCRVDDEQRLIRVLVVDEQWLVRFGLQRLFEPQRRMAVVADVSNAAGAVVAAREHEPDVVLVASRLPDADALEVCQRLTTELPSARVIIMSASDDEDIVGASILAGASGFLLKSSAPESFVEAVRTVAQGGSVIDPAVSDSVVRWMRIMAHGHGPRLSDQQRRILPLIGQGLTNRQIAEQLYLSEHTVKTYVSGMLKKLGMTRRAEVAAYIARHQHAVAF